MWDGAIFDPAPNAFVNLQCIAKFGARKQDKLPTAEPRGRIRTVAKSLANATLPLA